MHIHDELNHPKIIKDPWISQTFFDVKISFWYGFPSLLMTNGMMMDGTFIKSKERHKYWNSLR